MSIHDSTQSYPCLADILWSFQHDSARTTFSVVFRENECFLLSILVDDTIDICRTILDKRCFGLGTKKNVKKHILQFIHISHIV